MMKLPVHVCRGILCSLAVTCLGIADEPGEPQDRSTGTSISVNVSSSTTDDGVSEPKSSVMGKVTITGPDGVSKEFELGEEWPDGVDVKMFDGITGAQAVVGEVEPSTPRPMIGVMSKPVSSLLRRHLQLGMNGVVVTGVSKRMPAEKAGIVEGDIIVKAAGKNITNMEDLAVVVKESGEQSFDVELIHEGVSKTIALTPQVAAPATFRMDGMPQGLRALQNLQGFRMGPGMEIVGGEDADQEISKFMQQARDAIMQAQKRHGPNRLTQEMSLLKKRVAELEKRLGDAKTDE